MQLRSGTDSIVVQSDSHDNWLEAQLYLWRIRWGLAKDQARSFGRELVKHPAALLGSAVKRRLAQLERRVEKERAEALYCELAQLRQIADCLEGSI